MECIGGLSLCTVLFNPPGNAHHLTRGLSLLLPLFELKNEHLADQLEAAQLALETISQTVVAEENQNLPGLLPDKKM